MAISWRHAVPVLRELGARWLLYRAWYRLKRRSGLLELMLPAREWRQIHLERRLRPGVPSEPAEYAAWRGKHGGRMFIDADTLDAAGEAFDQADSIDRVEEALAGRWRYFEATSWEIGFPPDWHLDPLAGRRWSADRHWSRIDLYAGGDIKLVWEPSRFAIAYELVRAYAAERDDGYAEAFWELFEDWCCSNPPQRGPNWQCGQEVAFRALAWCFALYGFAGSAATTPERIWGLARALAVHGERIEANLAYARSQKNNHAISEATALWTIGSLFPELSRSPRWRETGSRVIGEECARQIYPDGGYVQHSTNYHRLMLELCTWASLVGRANGRRLPAPLADRLGDAVRLLYELQDDSSGGVPNLGANDGALLLPLSACPARDFRPALSAAHYLLSGTPLYDRGPWDEQLVWLFGGAALAAPRQRLRRESWSAPVGGYYTLRGERSWAMLRCASYRDRPVQADQLHLDLWWRGVDVARDPGTYLYNGSGPWRNGLATTPVHNTVTVDDHDQMLRAGRFLWLDWADGAVRYRGRSRPAALEYLEAEHEGYSRLGVRHRRGVLRAADGVWLIADELSGRGPRRLQLHWLLPDSPHRVSDGETKLFLPPPAGTVTLRLWGTATMDVDVVRAGVPVHPAGSAQEVDPRRGWFSPSYAQRQPGLSIVARVETELPARFVSLFMLGCEPRASIRPDAVVVAAGPTDEIEVRLSAPGERDAPIIRRARRRDGETCVTLEPGGSADA